MTIDKLQIEIGTILPNQAEVLAVDTDNYIVLAMLRNEFVTWEYNPANLSTYWGHYHSSIPAAVVDFQTRINTKRIISND